MELSTRDNTSFQLLSIKAKHFNLKGSVIYAIYHFMMDCIPYSMSEIWNRVTNLA